jgi:hypothetical protein
MLWSERSKKWIKSFRHMHLRREHRNSPYMQPTPVWQLWKSRIKSQVMNGGPEHIANGTHISFAGEIWDHLLSPGRESGRAIAKRNDGDSVVVSVAQPRQRLVCARQPTSSPWRISSCIDVVMRLGAPFIRCITSRGGSTCAAAFGGEVPAVEGRARLVGAMKDETQPSIRKGAWNMGKADRCRRGNLGWRVGRTNDFRPYDIQDQRSRFNFPTTLRAFISSRDIGS